ncbi:EB domain-containing julius seizure protein isoform 2-T16 [Cochliomyia hominivorax]
MKLNGALKPRQGASIKGCSPGVVLRSYRFKRFYNVNENVDNDILLNKCGISNENLNKKLNNTDNICIINKTQQKQLTALLTKQQKQKKRKWCEINNISNTDNDNNVNCSYFYYFTKNNKKINKSTTGNAFINLRSREFKKHSTAILETLTAVGTAEKSFQINEIDLKQNSTFNNVTTRQIKYTKRPNENNKKYKNSSTSSNNKNNNNWIVNNNNKDESKTKQVKVVKMTSNTSNYNVIFKRCHIKTNNNNNNNNKNMNSSINTSYREVNKFFLLNSNIYKNLNLTFIISRLFIQLKVLLFFIFSHAIKVFTKNTLPHYNRGVTYRWDSVTRCQSFSLFIHKLAKIMRTLTSFECSFERFFSKNMKKAPINPPITLCLMVYAVTVILLPQTVVGDDGENFFPINGIETTTPEFDYASRGQKKFGDKCENTLECGFPGSICDPKKKSCQCTEDLPVTNHIDKCGKEAAVNESCFFNEQCEMKYFQTECRDQKCVCRFDMTPVWLKDGSVECKGRGDKKGPETYIDPAMIGVLIGMALMFIIICVVLRLFSQARWRENRTIFNTPNPRLMNVSLLRESKLLHGQERRGSRMSVRAPSRQPSMASLRPHSPNPSLGSRSNSHGSNASATSLRSTRSNSVSPAGIAVNNSHHERKGSMYQHQQKEQHQQQILQQQEVQPFTQTNIISNPVAETVTVEIFEPEK